MTRFAISLLCCGILSAELSAPRIGLLRDREGVLRPLEGVAGAFVLGDPVPDDSGDCCSTENLPVSIEGDELVISRTGIRLRLPEPIERIERVSDEWFVLRTCARLYVVDIRPKREKIYLLPEASS